jgi:hypothetical protein
MDRVKHVILPRHRISARGAVSIVTYGTLPLRGCTMDVFLFFFVVLHSHPHVGLCTYTCTPTCTRRFGEHRAGSLQQASAPGGYGCGSHESALSAAESPHVGGHVVRQALGSGLLP